MKPATALLAAILFAAPFAVSAQTLTWTGAAGDGLWTSGANWNAGTAPDLWTGSVVINGPGTEVLVPSGTRLVLGADWGGYTEAHVTVGSGATLRVAGSLRTQAGAADDIQSYRFNDNSTLALDSGGYLQFGYFVFHGDSRLTAAGPDAIQVGSRIQFYDQSGFGALAAGAIVDGSVTFYGSREITFTPGTILGGEISLADSTFTTLDQAGTFAGSPDHAFLSFQLKGAASATVNAAGVFQSAEFLVGGNSTALLDASGALVDSHLALETDGTVTVGADDPLTHSTVGFADWTSTHTGGTLDLNGHIFTAAGLSSTSFDGHPVHEGTITSVAPATLVLDVAAGSDADRADYGGAITGAISVVKTGSGLQTLGRAADSQTGAAASVLSYTGDTSVEDGRLYINAPLLHSDVAVNSGATFGGVGTFNTITVGKGGTLDASPGPVDASGDTGTLHAAGVSFAPSSHWIVNLGDATGTAGASYDWSANKGGWGLLAVSGTLALPAGGTVDLLVSTGGSNNADGNWILAPANFDPAANYSFQFATAGTITGFDSTIFNIGYDPLLASFGVDPATVFTGSWSVTQHDNALYLNYTGASAVPEPSTYAALAGLAALGFVVWRRRG